MTVIGMHSAQVTDRFGVHALWADDTANGLPRTQMRVVERAWEEASAVLQAAGLPATFETVCAIVAAGRGYPARHARGLIERAVHEAAR